MSCEAVIEAHGHFVESVAHHYAESRDDVPDIVQMVWLKVHRKLSTFRGDSNIRTWLYTITRNATREHQRRERIHLQRPREALAAAPPPDVVEDPDEHLLHRERRDAVHQAIEHLRRPTQRAARDELDATGVPSSNRQGRWRARKQLRKLLDGDPRLN